MNRRCSLRKLTDTQRAEMRRRRRAGEKLAPLAAYFGVSEVTAWYHTRGISPAPRRDDPRVGRVVVLVGAELGEPPGWLRAGRVHRGKPDAALTRARRATALVLDRLGVDRLEIGRHLFRDAGRVRRFLAVEDSEARRVAEVVFLRLGSVGARRAA